MWEIAVLGIATLVAVTAYLIRLTRPFFAAMLARRHGRLPPGPPSYPIIGTLGIDNDEPWFQVQRWMEKYAKNGAFTYFLGPQLQVVLTDVELTRNLYRDPRLDARPDTNMKRLFTGHGVGLSEDASWKEMRKFEIMALKDFGRGSGSKNLIEEYCIETAADLLSDVQEEAVNGPFCPRVVLLKCIANSIASTLCGSALKTDDPRFNRFAESISIVMTGGSTTPNSPLNSFPWLAYFPPFRREQAKVVKRMQEIVETMQEVLTEHKRNYDPENIRDFMDTLLKEQARQLAEGNTASTFTDQQLLYTSVEVYLAGMDTSHAALEWGLLLVSSTPRVQQKCQEEMDRVLGQNKPPTYSDRLSLPYCEATMNEIGRIGVVDPFGLPHRCTEDLPVLNYTIPKDASVMFHYYGTHFSEEIWKDPFTFRPERFIDADGKFQANPNNLPFGTGRRMCSGDNFGKTIVFSSLMALLQRFTFRRADSTPWTQVKRINGISVHPNTFMVTASAR